MPNKLVSQKSLYLLQHAFNPVDWYPWGQEAFEKAKEEDKPIFLSIGYSTCHWCHVMAHECFEDEEVATVLNKYFVSIKVDREERPDIDQVYMSFCQAYTGSSGWPLSIFMTPHKKPFFAGTYFPKLSRHGMVGFAELIGKIALLWKDRREEIEKTGDRIMILLAGQYDAEGVKPEFSVGYDDIFRRAYADLKRNFDFRWGGLGLAPKFPTPHQVRFLLRLYDRFKDRDALVMAEKTLLGMASGGIHDHLGGGFHRYAVDQTWLIPHFEKMIYDQALITIAYLEGFQVTGKIGYLNVAEDTLDYVLREMTDLEGGFYSAQDADVGGEEGAYYLWTPDEIISVLGKSDGEKACLYFGVTPEGNLQGKSVLSEALKRKDKIEDPSFSPQEVAVFKKKLLEARRRRKKPLRDDKIITSWNGLMIAALAKAGLICRKDEYMDAAQKASLFILSLLVDDDDNVYHWYKDGERSDYGFLEDYAFLCWGLIEVFMATSQPIFIEKAFKICHRMVDLFWDEEHHGFYFSSRSGEPLILKNKELFDGAVPSGNSVALDVMSLLAQFSNAYNYRSLAEAMVEKFSPLVYEYPLGYTHFLCAMDRFIGPTEEFVIVPQRDGGDGSKEILMKVAGKFIPRAVFFVMPSQGSGYISHASFLPSFGEQTLIYWCKGKSCQPPMNVETFKLRWHER